MNPKHLLAGYTNTHSTLKSYLSNQPTSCELMCFSCNLFFFISLPSWQECSLFPVDPGIDCVCAGGPWGQWQTLVALLGSLIVASWARAAASFLFPRRRNWWACWVADEHFHQCPSQSFMSKSSNSRHSRTRSQSLVCVVQKREVTKYIYFLTVLG